MLTDEVEIIEENKPIEELKTDGTFQYNEIQHQAIINMQNKINELITEINKLKEN